MRTLVKLSILLAICCLSYMAYERVDRSDTWDLKKEVAAKDARIGELQQQLKEKDAKETKLRESMLICFPNATAQINAAFGVKLPTSQPTTQQAEKQ